MVAASRPTLVCFDLGGVLVRICRSWGEACELLGLPPGEPEALSAPHISARRRELVNLYQGGELQCAAYYSGLQELFAGVYSTADIERIHTVWTREEYPGVQALVAELNHLPGVATACLSNTNHAHWQRLSGDDGLGEYPSVQSLQFRLASHQLGCLKPGREIYLRAQATFERQPEQIVFFDDLAENVAAARSVGWHAFEVNPAGDTAAQMRSVLAGFGLLHSAGITPHPA